MLVCLNEYVVEMAGIEPACRKKTLKLSTDIACSFYSFVYKQARFKGFELCGFSAQLKSSRAMPILINDTR